MSYTLPTNNFRHYINGELVAGEGRTTTIICPGNGQEVASVALASKQQALAALEAAQAAFPEWSALPLEKGAKVSLFSRSSVDVGYGGTGSGSVNSAVAITMKDAFEKDGKMSVNPTLWTAYKNYKTPVDKRVQSSFTDPLFYGHHSLRRDGGTCLLCHHADRQRALCSLRAFRLFRKAPSAFLCRNGLSGGALCDHEQRGDYALQFHLCPSGGRFRDRRHNGNGPWLFAPRPSQTHRSSFSRLCRLACGGFRGGLGRGNTRRKKQDARIRRTVGGPDHL